MPSLKKALILAFDPIRNFFIKHPAVLSGIIIYAYFLLTTMGFYKELKQTHFRSFNFVEHFDALIWMWLLAVALVKVIEYRQRLADQEQLRREHKKALDIMDTQVATAHQMIYTLQHQINNPLAVIVLHLQRAMRKENLSVDLQEGLMEIERSVERIVGILREFAQSQGIETVESPVGTLIKPSRDHDTARTMDETSSA